MGSYSSMVWSSAGGLLLKLLFVGGVVAGTAARIWWRHLTTQHGFK